MKINLAKSAGFCFGVKRAIDTAFKAASSSDKVYMLGDIVHNEDVINDIKNAGIKKAHKLSIGADKTLLARAHGTGIKQINAAKKLGYKIIDATCPMVKEIHKIAKGSEEKGYKIIVIGDKSHDEVRGIVGQLKSNAIVIDKPSSVSISKISKLKKAAVVVQSTQNIDNVLKIINLIKPCVRDFKFFNTICRPTTIKQQDMKKMPLENDVMVIIGSKASANTKRLYEISKSLNPRSHWVQSIADIKKVWFKNATSAGITAGASTPDNTIQQVYNHIKKLR